MRIRNGVALASAAALAALAAGPASAASARTTTPHPVGNQTNWAHGIPRTIHRGQSVILSLWYIQTSHDVQVIGGYGISIVGRSAPAWKQLQGWSSSFLDPSTGKWEKAAYQEGNGTIQFNLPWGAGARPVNLLPNRAGHVYIKITFGKSAYLGNYRIDPYIDDYALRKLNGQYDSNYLNSIDHWYSFTLTR